MQFDTTQTQSHATNIKRSRKVASWSNRFPVAYSRFWKVRVPSGSILTTRGSYLACEQALLFGRVKRTARERASERRSREGHNFLRRRKFERRDLEFFLFKSSSRQSESHSPALRFRVSSRVPLVRLLFTIFLKWRACSQACSYFAVLSKRQAHDDILPNCLGHLRQEKPDQFFKLQKLCAQKQSCFRLIS